MYEIFLPESLTRIEDYAFYGCNNLSSIYNLEKVTYIGDDAFFKCNLGGAFNYIEINAKKIGDRAFESASMINLDLIIGDSVKSIGNDAFKNCYITSVTIGNSVTTIGSSAFENCRNLKEVILSQSVTSIGYHVFDCCDELNSVKVIITDYSAFCNNLIASKINKTLALRDKEGGQILNYIIPEDVTNIGDYAFYNCHLDGIVIPYGVTSIGWYSFGNCPLSKITSHAVEPPLCDNSFYNIKKSKCILEVPEASVNLYKASNEWKDFPYIKTTGIKELVNGKNDEFEFYDQNGYRIPHFRKGLNIVRMSNGHAKKILMK